MFFDHRAAASTLFDSVSSPSDLGNYNKYVALRHHDDDNNSSHKSDALVAITKCASQTIQITPNEEEPVREERSKYGVTCYGPNLREFQWRGPAGIISQSPQFRVHSQKLPMQRNQTGLLLVFETVKEEDVGRYFCTATGMDGRGHSISITLTVTIIGARRLLHSPSITRSPLAYIDALYRQSRAIGVRERYFDCRFRVSGADTCATSDGGEGPGEKQITCRTAIQAENHQRELIIILYRYRCDSS
ncbi:hypothetical protein QTP88_013666 [Uroleucon formosanum]